MKTYLFIVVLGLSALFIQPALASTIYSSGLPIDTLTLSQTGSCCSGADNFRYWTHFYSDVPDLAPFDIVRFQASTTANTKEFYIAIKNDIVPRLSTYTDGIYSTLNGGEATTSIAYYGPYSATKNGDIFSYTLPAPLTVGTGNYLSLIFTSSSSFASSTFPLSDGMGMYRLTTGYQYEYKTQRIRLELCSGSCDSSGFTVLPQLSLYPNTKINSGFVSGISSSTLQIDIGYFIDTSELPANGNGRPDVINAEIRDSNAIFIESRSKFLTLAQGNASTTLYLNENYPDGSYIATLGFKSATALDFVFRPFVLVNFTVSGGVVTVSDDIVTGVDTPFPAQEMVLEDCGLTSLSGCLNNTIKLMFYPSSESIDNIKTLFDTTMTTKAPFVYVAQISGLFNSMYTQTASSSATITINILGGSLDLISVARLQAVPFLSWLRTMLSAIIWIMASLYIYRRTLLLFNKS